jgi:biopolymer transport protein ExbB
MLTSCRGHGLPPRCLAVSAIERLLAQGGPTLYVIAAVAAVGCALFVERWLAVRGLVSQARELDRRLRELTEKGNVADVLAACNRAPAGLSVVLTRGVEAALRREPREVLLAQMTREGRRLVLQIRRGLGFLATLGSMSPFLGLFGTVLGIMSALQRIGQTGASGLDVVAGGVGEALVDTAAGILVAITLVLLHQLLRAQMARAVLEVQLLVEDAADGFARLQPAAERNGAEADRGS